MDATNVFTTVLTGWDEASRQLGPFPAAVLRATAGAASVAAAVWLVQAAVGRWLTPAWRYRLWWLVVLRAALPVLPGSPPLLRRVPAPLHQRPHPGDHADSPQAAHHHRTQQRKTQHGDRPIIRPVNPETRRSPPHIGLHINGLHTDVPRRSTRNLTRSV